MKKRIAAAFTALLLLLPAEIVCAAESVIKSDYTDGSYSACLKLPSADMELKSFSVDGKNAGVSSFFVISDDLTGNDDKASGEEADPSAGTQDNETDMSATVLLKAELTDDLIGSGGLKKIVITAGNENNSVTFEDVVDTGDQRYAVAERSLEQMKLILIIVAVSFLVLLAAFIILLKKKKTPAPGVSADPPEPSHMTVPLAKKREGMLGTVLNSMSTRILFKESAEKKIILTGVNDPEQVIEISSLRQTVIGRNQSLADAVIYNERSVSQKHCRIFCRNSKVYVEDLDSLNHTFVDGEQITEETEIFSGSVLKIGRLSFNVRIENV